MKQTAMQIEINTGKTTILLIKVPECMKPVVIDNFSSNTGKSHIVCVESSKNEKDRLSWITIPKGNWTLIGSAFELTEAQCRELVEDIEIPFDLGNYCYPDYNVYGKTGFKAFDTAKQSFASLLLANDIHATNPLQDEWDEACTFGHGGCTMEDYQKAGELSGNWIVLALDVEGN